MQGLLYPASDVDQFMTFTLEGCVKTAIQTCRIDSEVLFCWMAR